MKCVATDFDGRIVTLQACRHALSLAAANLTSQSCQQLPVPVLDPGVMKTLTHQRTGFEVRAIAPDVLRELLWSDDSGKPPVLLTDADGGAPLRCCLRPSQAGEQIALVSYAPLRRWAREAGAEPRAIRRGRAGIHTPGAVQRAGRDWVPELAGGRARGCCAPTALTAASSPGG